ncbi:hypothetical protein Trydic_g2695 [Trypoxylus dichotomus]
MIEVSILARATVYLSLLRFNITPLRYVTWIKVLTNSTSRWPLGISIRIESLWNVEFKRTARKNDLNNLLKASRGSPRSNTILSEIPSITSTKVTTYELKSGSG